MTNSFNDCKNLTLGFSLDFNHFPLPNGVNYVKFGYFVYLFFRKCSVIEESGRGGLFTMKYRSPCLFKYENFLI